MPLSPILSISSHETTNYETTTFIPSSPILSISSHEITNYETTTFIPSSPILSIYEMKPKTDNAQKFKQFNKLIREDKRDLLAWKNYKKTRICGSQRPCMRIYLNFCTVQGGKLLQLTKEYEMMSSNRLGTRHCLCRLVMEDVFVNY